MSAYRSPAAPAESSRFIHLRPDKVRRYVLAPCLWFLAFWFLIWPVAWVVQVVVTGEGVWRLALAPIAWLTVIVVITRTMRMETVLLGTRTIRRVGFLREHVMEWSAVESVRQIKRPRRRAGPPIIVLGLQGQGQELVVAPMAISDPEGVLSWALKQATTGNTSAIDERVRAAGVPVRRFGWYVPHLITGLVLSLAVGWFITGDQRRRMAERELRVIEGLPHAEKLARAEALFADGSMSEYPRCRAGSMITYSAARYGELDRAIDTCQRMQAVPCRVMPRCVELEALRDAHTALDEGDAARALSLIESVSMRGVFRDGIEISALRALGRFDEAGPKAERCLDVYGHSEDPDVRRLAEACRIE